MPEEAELRGIVLRITFHNQETGYTVFRFKSSAEVDPITCTSHLPGIREGASLYLKGSWRINPRFGRQLEVSELRSLTPPNHTGMIAYLASGLFKGIGKKRAKAIVDVFGMSSLGIISEEPARLVEAGISAKLAEGMQRSLQENRASERLTLYLQSLGVSAALALRIYRHYQGKEQGDLVALIESQPYRLADEVFGVGFVTADDIAKKLGVARDAPLRLTLGLKHCLSRAASEGHCYLPETVLLSATNRLLQVPDVDFSPLLEQLLQAKELITEGEAGERCIYLPAFYHAEIGVARALRRLNDSASQMASTASVSGRIAAVVPDARDDKRWLRQIRAVEKNLGMTLAQEQIEALWDAQHQQVQIITGGPGTGKTTLLKALLILQAQQNSLTLLAAPTGRAARRLSEVSGAEAKTLHRLLEYSPQGGTMAFMRNEENPLQADVVIVDEASMIDILLFYHLLKALPEGCRLILVGDQDQLPSVGPGQVLADLIASGSIAVTKLRTVFRQAEQSRIVVNAHRINQGLMPHAGDRDSDFFFIEATDPLEVLTQIVSLCRDRLPSYLKVHPIEDIQVLCPMRRGVVGVQNLNAALQEALNPRGTASSEGSNRLAEEDAMQMRFRLGDKVMQLRNNYEKDVFNGDIGSVVCFEDAFAVLVVEYPEAEGNRRVRYRAEDLDELSLAYAISVHKAQGSEYPVVVMPLLKEHRFLLERNLLYTAITRAKRLLVLIGDRDLMRYVVSKSEASKRFTMLKERLS